MNARARVRKIRARFTPTQVAEAWAIDERTVMHWISAGILTASRGKYRRPLIRRAALKRALLNPHVAKTVAKAQARMVAKRCPGR